MNWKISLGIVWVTALSACVFAGTKGNAETNGMPAIELNLATNLRGLLKFTNDKDEPRQVDIDRTFSSAGEGFAVKITGLRIIM